MPETSTADTTSQESTGTPQPLFNPPAGGDLVLRSNDGTEFQVHSVILKLASVAFDGMISIGTKDAVELSESAATISLVLRLIYPNQKNPTMTSLDMLSDCLSMVDKYAMEAIIEGLDEQIASNIPPYCLVSSDPIRAHQLAVQYRLSNTKAAAARLASVDKQDLCDLRTIMQLVQTHPPSSLIRLIGVQGVRAKILADVLFNFGSPPILPSPSSTYLTCDPCVKANEDNGRQAGFGSLPTSWVLAWVQLAYRTLLSIPLESSGFLFDANVFMQFKGASDVCQRCLDQFWTNEGYRTMLNEWVQAVKDVLQERLKVLELLYPL